MTSRQFTRNSDPNVLVEDQQQARNVTARFASRSVSTRRHLVALHGGAKGP